MRIEITEAARSEGRLLASLLDDYLRELSSHREIPVGATDSASYPYLDAYGADPGRHAFLIRCAGRIVGFALVREPASTGAVSHQLAEFYVAPESRRLGIGRGAVLSIWKRFPGQWELRVHVQNTAAIRFWASCAKAAASNPPEVQEVRASDGRRIQFSFYVEARCSTARRS